MAKRQPQYQSTHTKQGSLGDNIIAVARWYRDELDRALEPFGYSYAGLEPLFILERSHPIYQSTVARAVRVRAPTLVPILDRLVRDGYVLSKEAPVDRRKRLIEITPEGREFAYQCRVAIRTVSNDIFASIKEEALSPAAYVLAALRQQLEKRAGRPSRG